MERENTFERRTSSPTPPAPAPTTADDTPSQLEQRGPGLLFWQITILLLLLSCASLALVANLAIGTDLGWPEWGIVAVLVGIVIGWIVAIGRARRT